jgi:hypothetical protein
LVIELDDEAIGMSDLIESRVPPIGVDTRRRLPLRDQPPLA